MRIITVSREFGSGGREMGKRLADILQMDYYDREIITAVSEQTSLDEKYIESAMNSGTIRTFPLTFGKTFLYQKGAGTTIQLLAHQHKIIRKIADKGRDFVIVGRSAEAILHQYQPFRIFVYADIENRIRRCRERSEETLSDKEIEKRIRQVDRSRKECHSLVSDTEWGDKRGYHLCINTSNSEMKKAALLTAEFAKEYFGRCGE